MNDHLVRIGPLAHLGRFQPTDGAVFRRNMSVVCRTSRGLEFGSVLNAVGQESPSLPLAGSIIRGATPEDLLLWSRLQKHRIEAIDRCQTSLNERGVLATLMDCEVLFDGQSIFFYFLGEVGPEVEVVTSKLAEEYEATAQLKQFADAMTLGCGPDCGTKEGGCESGGCSTCAIAKACQH